MILYLPYTNQTYITLDKRSIILYTVSTMKINQNQPAVYILPTPVLIEDEFGFAHIYEQLDEQEWYLYTKPTRDTVISPHEVQTALNINLDL